MNRIKKFEIILIIVTSGLIVLPFVNQAYHIDDDIYLNAAIKYNESGLDSFKGKSEQEGFIIPNYYLTHPLLWPWLIAIFIKLFNSTNESILHMMSIVNMIIIGLSIISISKKFSKEPLIITLFFLFVPAVMLLSHVMMTDIPTLAFFLLAIALHIEGIEKKSSILFILSGIAATAAWGISYQALFVLFLIGLYNFQVKEKDFKAYLPIIIPIVFFILWFLGTWKKFGIPHPLIAFQWGGEYTRNIFDDFLSKFIGNINSIGAATIFPLFILIVYFLISRFRKYLILSFMIALLGVFLIVSEYSVVQKLLFITYFSAGFFILLRFVLLFKDSLKIKDKRNIFLSIWFITFFTAIAIAMPLGIARYLLPGFLPAVIVIVNDLKDFFPSKRFKFIIYSGLFVTALWSILCSIADYNLADIYRKFALEFGLKYKSSNVWFCSDGLKWYMEKEGYQPLLYEDVRPIAGDIVVISSELWPYYVPEVMDRTQLIDRVDFDSNFPVRTMNLSSHAGFYDHLEGALLPFSITKGKYEEFLIYKVIK